MMTIHSPMLLGLGALALAACALAEAGGRSAAAPRGPQEAAAITCALRLTEGRGGMRATAELRASTPMTGQYTLRLRRGAGVVLDQAGPFSASAGERLVLGEVALSGGGALDAGLSLRVGGRDHVCPVLRN